MYPLLLKYTKTVSNCVLYFVLCTTSPPEPLCKPIVCYVYDEKKTTWVPLYFTYTRKIQYLSVYLVYPCLLCPLSHFIYCMSVYIYRIVNLFEFGKYKLSQSAVFFCPIGQFQKTKIIQDNPANNNITIVQ